MVEQNIPTPNARDWKDSTQKSSMNALEAGSQMTLGRYVHKYPTPAASDNRDRGHMGMPSIKRRAEKGKQINLSMSVSDVCGALNPPWVEWLMGWPIGWTNLEPIGDLDWRDWKTDPADDGEVPRVATGIKCRADRLKAIGNGQVPQVAALAWTILTK